MKPGKLDFETVHNNFEPKIRRYLARMAGEAESEDLTQETFLKVSHSLERFRGDSSLSTWIYKIATRTAIDSFRKKGREQEKLEPVVTSSDKTEEKEDRDLWSGEVRSLDQQIIRSEMNACIRNVISTLPETYRAVIVLSELEGFGNEEIAAILGTGIDTVKMRLHRGRAKLKEALAKQCILYRDERNEFACDKKSGPGSSRCGKNC